MVAGVVALTVVALGPNESQAGNAVTSTDLDVVQAVSNDAIISEITVRYKPGIERLDSDGRPTGTGDIEGFSFLFGDDYPNNIASLRVSPSMTSAEAFAISHHIRASGTVEFADPMFPLELSVDQWQNCTTGTGASVNDSCLSSQQWYLDLIDVEAVWGTTADAPFARVAVIDSGILPHTDLDGQTLSGYDFIGPSYANILGTYYNVDGLTSAGDGDAEDSDPRDEGQGRDAGDCHNPVLGWLIDPTNTAYDRPARDSNWHGTAVASIIAAKRNNNSGISGIAPAAKIIPVRTLGKCIESDDVLNLVRSIDWAAGVTVMGQTNANPAHVINLSLGSNQGIVDYCPTVYAEAIQRALDRNIVVVASAGNDDDDAREHTPSNCPGVISVGAVGPPSGNTISKAGYSNYDADIVAPGGAITTDYDEGILVASNTQTRAFTTGTPEYKYKFGQGTSYAAPVVSSLVALAITKYQSSISRLTPAAIKASLQYTASLGSQCEGCGNGLPTATALIEVLSPSAAPTTPRSVTPTGGPNTTNQGQVTWSAPISNQWNPITAYVAKAYSAASGGTVVDTCTPQSLSQLSCVFDDLQENTNYFVSVTATASTSIESTRTQLTTYRRAAAPTGVSATAGAGKATVRWNEVTDMGDFSGFGLYEAIAYTAQTGGTSVSSCYGNTECDIENLTGGTQYWVAVSIMTGQHPGGSIQSARIAVTPTGAPVNQTPVQTSPAGGNNSTGTSTGTGSVAPTVPVVKSTVGKSVTVSAALKAAKTKAAKGTKTSLSVAAKDKKVCQVVRGVVKVVGKGTCTVTITMKPTKGKSTKKTIQITA